MRGDYGLNQFFGSVFHIMQTGISNPLLNRVYALFSARSPQILIQVNREKMDSLRADFDSAIQSFNVNFVGACVNEIFLECKARHFYMQSSECQAFHP